MVVDDSYTGANLVLLVGCPRSGTTWLQRLLATHPRIRTGQESHLFDFYVGPQLRKWEEHRDPVVTGRGGVGIGCYVDDAQFTGILRRYLFSLLGPILEPVAAGELFLEKTPAHAFFIPEIVRFLPDARVVHAVRDPRDVTASLLAASRSWGAAWAPRTAARAASMWVGHVEAVYRAAGRLRPDRFLEIRYEAVAENPTAELRRMMEFLHLTWADAEIARAISANRPDSIRAGGGTPIPLRGEFGSSNGQVVEPAGFVRHGRVGGWRRDLSRREHLVVQAVAGPSMRQLGYEPDGGILAGAAAAALRLARHWRGTRAWMARSR